MSRSTSPRCLERVVLAARHLAFAATALVAASGTFAQGTATGETYPSRPIRFIVPFPTGGFSDILARIVGQGMSDGIGQPIVVENRPGAGGNIGADLVARAQPDGYTLLINSLNYVIAPSVMSMPFDTLKDLEPVSLIADGPPLVMVVNPASAYGSVQQVISYARSNPGKLNIATAGTGTSTHLAAEMFRSMARIDAVLVPYKGGTGEFTSVISGESGVNFPLVPAVLSMIQSGRLRALAVTSNKRITALPDVPTMAEAGVADFEAVNFLGLVAPAKTPRPVIQKLQREIAALAKRRDFVERIERFGMQPIGSTPEEFDGYIRQQMKKWADVVRATGARQ